MAPVARRIAHAECGIGPVASHLPNGDNRYDEAPLRRRGIGRVGRNVDEATAITVPHEEAVRARARRRRRYGRATRDDRRVCRSCSVRRSVAAGLAARDLAAGLVAGFSGHGLRREDLPWLQSLADLPPC